MSNLFDPLFDLPAALTDITRVDRGFTPSPNAHFSQVLEDFVNPTGTSTFGLQNDASGITISHGFVPDHDETYRAATISWTSPGRTTFFQSNWAAPGSGFSLNGHLTVDFRVERALDPLNPTTPTDFAAQLVDSRNELSDPISVQDFVDLRGPVGGLLPPGPALEQAEVENLHSMLQTVRIPVHEFKHVDQKSIRGIRFTFDKTPSGAIYLGNIRATCQNDDDRCGLDDRLGHRPVGAQHRTATRPAASAGAQGDAVEVGLASDNAFLPRDEMLVLRIGDYQTQWSRYPEGDTHRVIFKIPREDYDALRDGDPMTVHYGRGAKGPIWNFGPFDKSQWK
jgi:hypothetical protein